MNNQAIIESILAKSGMSLFQLEKQVGTSESSVYFLRNVVKICKPEEFMGLKNLRNIMGNDYVKIFPRFNCLSLKDDFGIYEVEYLGDYNLEKLIFTEDQENILEIVRKVISAIRVFSEYQKDDVECRNFFTADLTSALQANCENLNLEIPKINEANLLFTPTLCHRDLSVVNIIINTNKDVKLIDPRTNIPHSKSEIFYPYGNVAIDCASLVVSLDRKNEEVKKHKDSTIDRAIDLLDDFVEEQVEQNIFCRDLYLYCLVTGYSMYATCKCDYCLAPERKWLWEIMYNKTAEILEKF